MILSQTAIYAIKAVLFLAETDREEPVRVDDIARALDVPRNYLSKILHALTRAGLLSSTRGPHGGFRLRIDASRITLEQVVEPFDELVQRSACLLGRERCSDENPCAAHTRWRSVSAEVRDFFRDTTVRSLSNDGPAIPDIAPAESGNA